MYSPHLLFDLLVPHYHPPDLLIPMYAAQIPLGLGPALVNLLGVTLLKKLNLLLKAAVKFQELLSEEWDFMWASSKGLGLSMCEKLKSYTQTNS